MRFDELTLHNFGPYLGDHRLKFPVDAERNVTLVYGDNMRGKTTLLHALRWALYGVAMNRQRREIDIRDLVNSDARQKGDWHIVAHLTFTVGNDKYELRRSADRRDSIMAPRNSGDFRREVLLRKNGEVVTSDLVASEINKFIPEEISRFYLFDAELLQEYEILVSEDGERARAIKIAIETVLGVPALINGRNDIGTLLKKANAAYAQEAKQHKATEALAADSLRIQEEIDLHEADLKQIQEQLAASDDELAEFDARLREIEGIRETVNKLEQLRATKQRLATEERDYRRQRADIMRSAWQDMLLPAVEKKRSELTRRWNELQGVTEQRGATRATLQLLQEVLEKGHCPTCELTVDEIAKRRLGGRIADLQRSVSALNDDASALQTVAAQIEALRRVRGTDAPAALTRCERDIGRVSVELTDVESEIETLELQLSGHDVEEISQLQRKRENILRLRGHLEAKIEVAKQKIDDGNRKLNNVGAMMRRTSPVKQTRTQREVEVLDGLSQVFKSSIDQLRDLLRRQIETFATSVFKELTTEATYRGLAINDNYGLTILDRDERHVSVRSAGAEQIVALSLLAALNRSAHCSAPVIIDTPFARLDPKHRHNIMRFLPSLAEQVVFLVHEGELPRNSLEAFGNRIAARYQIERISSSHSALRPVTGD